MDNYISPNFRWGKLEAPSLDDLIDVFDDRVRNWLLEPAKSLLHLPHGFVATISLLLTYFESIQTYVSGRDSKGSSQRFFIDGFLAVFGAPGIDKSQLEKMARTIYTEGRCGFFHNAMSGGKIQYSTIRDEALTVTQPKVDGKIDFNGEVRSIVINPDRFHWCVQRHFDKYISDLRRIENATLRENFRKAVDIEWDLEGEEPIIGTTEEEFKRIDPGDDPMEPHQEERVKFLDYIVAYFDLMGQKERLKKLRESPTNEQERIQFDENKRQTCDAVKYIRRGLKIGFENFKRASLAEINDDPTSELRKMVECNYQFHFYSDSFAVTCRYSNDENQPLIQHVYALLLSLSFMIVTCLRDGTPVRGGVEIGKTFEWPEGGNLGIYGPVMLDVEDIESRIAWYPRIVIGNKLNESISNWSEKLNRGDCYYTCYKEAIESCRSMSWLDKDGMSTLDYLGPSILGIVQSIQDPVMPQNVKLGWEFVSREYERLRNDEDSQLALKYSLLKDYYLERLPIWNGE